jgi:hypothetical protein
MSEFAIRFDSRAWGGYAWALYSREDSTCEWEIAGSSMTKRGAKSLLKSNEVLVEEDPEPPTPLVRLPNAKQLKCAHDAPGRSWYSQTFGTGEDYRFEVCEECKSITLARGKVPWWTLPRGYALLRIES